MNENHAGRDSDWDCLSDSPTVNIDDLVDTDEYDHVLHGFHTHPKEILMKLIDKIAQR